MVRLLPPPSRDQGNRTREREQKTLVGLRESFLTAAPGLKAHLEAEPSARPVPLPGHCRLRPRLVLPAQAGMMASTLQHSPAPSQSQLLTRKNQHETRSGLSNIVQDVIALWRLVRTGDVPEGVVLRPAV